MANYHALPIPLSNPNPHDVRKSRNELIDPICKYTLQRKDLDHKNVSETTGDMVLKKGWSFKGWQLWVEKILLGVPFSWTMALKVIISKQKKKMVANLTKLH